MPKAKHPTRRFARGADPEPASFTQRLLDALTILLLRTLRFSRDVLAVLLLAFALITLVALSGWTSGFVADAWASLLERWLGWGAAILPLTAAAAGTALLLEGVGRKVEINWWRVLAGEATAFSILGLLALATSESLPRAEAGDGGGLIGWGIAFVFGRLLGPALRTALLAGAAIAGFAIAADLSPARIWLALDRLRVSLRERRAAAEPDLDSPTAAEVVAVGPAPAGAEAAPKRPPKLEPQFRKNFKVDAPREEPPAKRHKRDKRLPPLDLLEASDSLRVSERDINLNAGILERTLAEFGVPARVIDFKTGPSVTQFAVEPGFVERPGPDGVPKRYKVRVSQISALANDLALALSAATLRIEAPVPGRSYVGIEVPNRRTSTVSLRPVMESEAFQRIASPLAIALGRDVSGASVAANLAAMPHLLIAGTTGSGKSVCITALTACLVANNTPDDLRLVMIDPKMVELVRFNGLPHLFGKVETDLTRILGVLRWCTKEMDRRYKLFEQTSARDLEAYNRRVAKRKDAERLPRIVILLDELADLMMMAPDETEKTLIRLAQMARATGMHLVVATQRPSTDIVTGLIKANFPARISFTVASSVDSRVILDTPGAESLLGRGDMLFLSPEVGAPVRLQGCFVSDREVERIVTYWRELFQDDAESPSPIVEEAAPEPQAAPWDSMLAREAVVEDKDDQIERAIEIVKRYGTASASLLQRKLKLGYPRAARLMDELYEMGIVGRSQTGGKTREVLIEEDDDPIGRAANGLGDEE